MKDCHMPALVFSYSLSILPPYVDVPTILMTVGAVQSWKYQQSASMYQYDQYQIDS